MNRISKLGCITVVTIITLTACTRNPKVITASSDQPTEEASTGIFSEEPIKLIPDQSEPALADGIHTVTVEEVLPTVKYVYLRVKEGTEEFWIATNKMEVKVGKTYFYRGGLLKTDFESKEHNRVFDKMYLVSELVESEHGSHATAGKPASTGDTGIRVADGSVTISELVSNPKKYAGKTIQISGRCVKINHNIMGRNWVHLQDGTKDDFDLVITCDVQIPVGHTVTMTGNVVLDKDFGAGYQYAILLEKGEIVQ